MERYYAAYVPHGTGISWESEERAAELKSRLIARLSTTVSIDGTRYVGHRLGEEEKKPNCVLSYCCNVVWGWFQSFETENFAGDDSDDDWLLTAAGQEQERATEVCYPMSNHRCFHDGRVKSSSCGHILVHWWR